MDRYEVTYRGKSWEVRGLANTVNHATFLWKENVAWRRRSGIHEFPRIKELVK